MVKKKVKKGAKKKETKKKKSTGLDKKAAKPKQKKVLKKKDESLGLESREIWKKNVVLVLILLLILVINGWLYFRDRRVNNAENIVPRVNESPEPATAQIKNINENSAPKDELDGLNEQERKIVQDLMDKKEMESWKTYKNTAYSFMLKYPGDWPEPAVVKPEEGKKYKFKVSFRNNAEEGKDQKGFDIYIYRLLKGSNSIQPDYTDNLTKKDTAAEDYSNCGEIGTAYLGENKYPAMEMYYLKNDPCFAEAYYLVLEKGAYIYDIIPIPQGGINHDGYDGRRTVAETLPEFRKMLSTFSFVQITARKTTVVKRITAPKPVAETRNVGGKRMCAKKNDKPRKSKQHKKKHMDMECCLDPDETPNPWCTY